MENSIGIEIAKILDKYLPADRIGSEREKLRMSLHNELTILLSSQLHLLEEMEKITLSEFYGYEWGKYKLSDSLLTVIKAYLEDKGK